MVDFLSQVVDCFDQCFTFSAVVFKLFLEFWCLQQFLFEIQLSVQVSAMVVETRPNIIDSISKSFEFFACDWQFFDDTMLKFLFLEGDQVLQSCDFTFIIFKESHKERFQSKRFEKLIEIGVNEMQSKQNNGGHIDKLKLGFFVYLPSLLLKGSTLQVDQQLRGGNQYIRTSIHPNRKSIEPQIDRVLVIIQANSRYPASFEKQSISVDLSQILDQHQDFWIYKSELESYIEIDGQTQFIADRVEMSDLLLLLHLWGFSFRQLIIDLHCFRHPLCFEFLYFRASTDARNLIDNFVRVKAASQKLQSLSIAKTKEQISLRNHNRCNSIFLLLPQIIHLQWTTHYHCLLSNLPDILHVQIDDLQFTTHTHEVMKIL